MRSVVAGGSSLRRDLCWTARVLAAPVAALLGAFGAWPGGRVLSADAPLPPETKEAPPDPAPMLRGLEEGDFEARQKAAHALEQLGEAARGVLEKALRESEDVEVRETATHLLGRLHRASLDLELYDRDGKPLPGIQVEANLAHDEQSLVQDGLNQAKPDQAPLPVSDGQGRIRLTGLKPGLTRLDLNFKDAFFAQGVTQIWRLDLRPGENRLSYILTRTASAKGTVLSDASGKPLEGAKVFLIQESGMDYTIPGLAEACARGGMFSSCTLAGVTDAKGEFVLEKVAEGAYFVVVSHDEYVTSAWHFPRVREGREARLTEPVRLTEKSAALGSLQLQVLDKAGKPLPKTKVQVRAERVLDPKKPGDAELAKLRNQGWQFPQAQELESDEHGKLEVKDLQPGVYTCSLLSPKTEPILIKDLCVAAGKSTRVDGQGPSLGGRITGRVLSPAGLAIPGAQVVLTTLRELEQGVSSNEEGLHPFIRRRFWERARGPLGAQVSGASGQYEFKGVLPGSYVLLLHFPTGRRGILGGVRVEEGQETEAPDLVVPGVTGGRGYKVEGHVLLSGGVPAQVAQIMLQFRSGEGFGSGNQYGNLSKEGRFLFYQSADNDRYPGREPWRLSVRVEGYKPCSLDLTKPGVDLAHLEIRLEKQTYGKVRVAVTDPEGRPLQGARVMPLNAQTVVRGAEQIAQGSRYATAGSGQVLLSGLAVGRRRFQAWLPGYFSEKPAEAIVEAERELSLAITMSPDLRVKGRVQMPVGIDPHRLLVCLQASEPNLGEIFHTTSVDAAGRYEFKDLMPAKARVFALYPNRVSISDPVEFEMGKAPHASSLAIVPVGGLKLALGKEAAHQTVTLANPGAWNPIRRAPDKQWGASIASVLADAEGGAEFFGLAPGLYDLVWTPPSGVKAWALGPKEGRAQSVWCGLRASSYSDGWAGFERSAPLQMAPSQGEGRVSGRIVLKEDEFKKPEANQLGHLQLHVVGEASVASLTFYLPELDPARATLVTGALPPGLKVAAPGEFQIRGLAPGAYELFLDLPKGRNGGQGDASGLEEPSPSRLSFKVEKGQTVDLGEIPYEFTAAVLEKIRKARAAREPGEEEIGADEVPVQRP